MILRPPPTLNDLAEGPEQFLEWFGGPTAFCVPGRDSSRCRGYVTLLHGNEPSGLGALLEWLRAGEPPAVDLLCVVGAVDAARQAPVFSQRLMPSGQDLNRCFDPPETDLTRGLLQVIIDANCEAVIDVHNTTGRTAPYGIGLFEDDERLALTSLFARHYVKMDVRVGALVEALSGMMPGIAIECGRVGDPESDRIALDGLRRFAACEPPRSGSITTLRDTLRVELRADAALPPDLDRLNFEPLDAGARICLAPGGCPFEPAELFDLRDGYLVAGRPMVPVMMTTDETAARVDCVGYVALAMSTSG